MSDSNRLVEHILGLLSPEERQRLDAELAGSEALRRQRRETEETLMQIAGTVPVAQPRARVRDRLLASLEPEHRFDAFVERLTRFLDLPAEAVRDLLRLAAAPKDRRWRRSGLRGLRIAAFAGGPNIAEAECSLLTMTPGFRFPRHRHRGDEWGFVLQGSIEEADGSVYAAGDIVHNGQGSEHRFQITGDQPALLILLLEGTIEWLEPGE